MQKQKRFSNLLERILGVEMINKSFLLKTKRDLLNVFARDFTNFSKDDIAKLLNLNPKLLSLFESCYYAAVFSRDDLADIFTKPKKFPYITEGGHVKVDKLAGQVYIEDLILDELWRQTEALWLVPSVINSAYGNWQTERNITMSKEAPVTPADLVDFSEDNAPQLTGYYMQTDVQGHSSEVIMSMYDMYRKTGQKMYYYNFLVGLGLLDLDSILYQLLRFDDNTMSRWIIPLERAVLKFKFFKIPATVVIKVPMTLLQMSRLCYFSLSQSTKDIANEFCQLYIPEEIRKKGDVFIKTGTFSSKFDFSNARVSGEKEISEIGEYLLFISNIAVNLSSPLNTPTFYGVSCNREWVIREYIQDVENNPCIYKGLPLHTEYRAFIDFDTDEVLGIFPYWDYDLMKKRFSEGQDADSPHQIHDYIILQKHYEVMQKRFDDNVSRVQKELEQLISEINLKGQWAMDIMQNGDDFYIIDMSVASSSALKEKLKLPLRPYFYDRVQEMNEFFADILSVLGGKLDRIELLGKYSGFMTEAELNKISIIRDVGRGIIC